MAKLFLYILVFLTCFFLDKLTKNLANEKLILHTPVQLTKRFYLVLVHNKGAAYGFLKKRTYLLRFLSAVSMFLLLGLFVYCFNNGYSPGFMIAMSVVLAGAAGNFLERIFLGRVTDFLFYKWKKLPIFNLADLFLVFGVLGIYANVLF